MKGYDVLWKKVGQTPLQALQEFRTKENIAANIPLTYAGRLDPMAEGKLLILLGDECKNKSSYIKLDKEYEFEILFGFSSDTGDVLGLAEYKNTPSLRLENLEHTAKSFIGKHTFQYPLFSSKTVQGKQLHKWALEGRSNEIEIPTYISKIYSIKILGSHTIYKEELEKTIEDKIGKLLPVDDPEKGLGTDFRREPILNRWREILISTEQNEFQIIRLRAVVSSGTYIRSLAEKIGETLGTKGLAYSIKRTKIGKYAGFSPFKFWLKRF